MTVKPAGMELEYMKTAITLWPWDVTSEFVIMETTANGGIFFPKKDTFNSKLNSMKLCKESQKTPLLICLLRLQKHFMKT